MSNILLAPTHKIADRKAIADRVLDALLADSNARYNTGRGEWRPLTEEEEANWVARHHFFLVSWSYTEATHDAVQLPTCGFQKMDIAAQPDAPPPS